MSEKTSEVDEQVDKKEDIASEAIQEEEKETVEEPEEEAKEQPPLEEAAAEEPEKEAEEEEAAEEGEEEIEIVEERIYTIPFRKVWATPRGKRSPRASRMLRDFARRHMKSEDVEISNEVNEELWARGIKKPPREIKVRLVKDKEGRVIVYPATAA